MEVPTFVDCPRCRLINPQNADVCDCGYNAERLFLTVPEACEFSGLGHIAI